ncbi:MAG: integrase [Akkermansiaceae bacterium]|jgi:integrase
MSKGKIQSSNANRFRFSKQPGSRFYSVRVMVNGQRRRFSTGETSLQKAQSKAAAIMADIKSQGFDAAIGLHAKRRNEVPVDPTVEEFCALYSTVIVAQDTPPSPSSSRRYTRSLERICKTAKVGRIRNLNAAAIEKFKDSYIRAALVETPLKKKSGGAPAKNPRDESSVRTTVNGILRNAAALFSHRLLSAYELRGLSLENPFKGAQLKRIAIKAHSPFSRVLLDKIWQEAPMLRDGDRNASPPDPKANRRSAESIDFRKPHPDAFVIFLLELGLGLRRNEADKAEWEWVRETPDGRLMLEVRESEGFIPKSKQSRVIPIEQAIWDAVVALKKDPRYIVQGPQEKPKKEGKKVSMVYRCERAHRVLVAWLRRAGLNDPKPCHALRKEFGSYVATHFSLFHAQKILGHSSPAVTSSYYASLTELPLLQPSRMGNKTTQRQDSSEKSKEQNLG